MQFTQIKETCLYVQDLSRTEAFYHEKLKLPIIGREEGRHIFFKAGASVLLCFIADATRDGNEIPAHFAKGKIHLAFEVSRNDYNTVKARIRSENIPIEHEHNWGDGLSSFYFRDPDGHSIEIVPEGIWD